MPAGRVQAQPMRRLRTVVAVVVAAKLTAVVVVDMQLAVANTAKHWAASDGMFFE